MAESASFSQPPTSSSAAPNNLPNSNTTTTTASTTQAGTTAGTADADIDADIDVDIKMGGDNPVDADAAARNLDGPAPDLAPGVADSEVNPVAAAPAAPTKKDISLREFLSKMDDYAPIIPDAVTAHYLTLSGLPPPGTSPNSTPPHLARLISLATQKFIADIAADAYQYSRIRSSNTSSGANPMGNLGALPGQVPGVPGAAGGADAGGGGVGGSKGKPGASTSHLGVQRAGYGGGGQGGSGQGRTVLTMEDLGMAVGEYGVNLKRGEFYR